MKAFSITVRTAAHMYLPYIAIAASAAQAGEDAAQRFDEACGITVKPAGPQ